MKRSVKVAILQTLLVSYIYIPLYTCQQLAQQTGSFGGAVPNTHFQGAGTGVQSPHLSSTGTQFQGATVHQGAGVLPVAGVHNSHFFQDPTMNLASRGYSNTPIMPNTYMSGPVHGQYWTGHVQPYPQQYPQQYGNYYQPGYDQYGANYYPTGALPAQQYYPQQYPTYGQYGQYQYPGFDAQYWTGHYYPQPVYQQHGVPMYHQGYPGQYYPGQHYPGQYYPGYYPQYPGAYPYGHRPYKKGFLGGMDTNKLAKTLLGAVAVGAVAGAVARG